MFFELALVQCDDIEMLLDVVPWRGIKTSASSKCRMEGRVRTVEVHNGTSSICERDEYVVMFRIDPMGYICS